MVSSLDEETIRGEETIQGRKLYEEIRYMVIRLSDFDEIKVILLMLQDFPC